MHAVFSATMEKKYLVFDGSRVNSNDDPAIGGQAKFIHCLLGKGELYSLLQRKRRDLLTALRSKGEIY